MSSDTALLCRSSYREKALPSSQPGQRLAAYVARRGIKAEIAEVRSAGRPIAEVLPGHAQDIGAGLIGEYSHSRTREFVLGGATAGILGELTVAALLSH
jgi:nucleotide-binding universal stress UspA family protein